MNVIIHYDKCVPKKDYEVIITSFANAVSKVIELPKIVEVCLYPLAPNVHGGIDGVRVNRIGLNYNLLLQDIPLILTHELIHVHQKHKGVLKIDGKNNCYWYGILQTNKLPEQMTYEEYQNLPWEVDVRNKQTEVFKKALALLQQ
jgi:hypothetical protein